MKQQRLRLKCAALCLGTCLTLAAQESDIAQVTKYKLFDVGTLGGSSSELYTFDNDGGLFSPRVLNARGQLVGASLLNPEMLNPEIAGSFLWTAGTLTTLPTLPNGTEMNGGSNAFGVNNSGLAVGASNYGLIDPANNNLYYQAVSWTNGVVQDLGDFGGKDSWASYVNDSGLVVGYAYNAVPDPFSFYGTQYHAATWLNGQIQDLGTLGGTDSEAWTANDSGEVIGISLVNNTPIPPFNQPQEDAFVWTNGSLIDLGNLGGVFSTPTSINAAGQVSVISYDATNQFVGSYLWDRGEKINLQSTGGNFLQAVKLNDFGISIGECTDPSDVNFLASVWGPRGKGKLLGSVGADTGSIALDVNRHNVIVGGSGSVTLSGSAYAHAFVWRNGKIQDLNTLIPANSPLTLNVAYAINDAGVIAGLGTTSTGDTHAFVLAPVSTSGAEAFHPAASSPAAPGSSVRMKSALIHPPGHYVNLSRMNASAASVESRRPSSCASSTAPRIVAKRGPG